MRSISIFLVTLILIVGTVGCGGPTPAKYSLAMAASPGEGGTATDLTDASPYVAGTEVSIEAVTAEGYRFVNWTAPAGTFDNTSAPQTTFSMPAQNVTVTANFAPFSGGSGTQGDPYQIVDWYDLDDVRDYLESHFILMNDLDSTTAGYEELASETANDGEGWQPIGGWYEAGEEVVEEPFEGVFDGQGHEIEDLYINRPSIDEHIPLMTGLFGWVNGDGVVRNVGVVNCDVTGWQFVGCLAGFNRGCIENCHASGDVGGDSFVGGLVGVGCGPALGCPGEGDGTIISCYATSVVTATGCLVGGLVGVLEGEIGMSYAEGDVYGGGGCPDLGLPFEGGAAGGLAGWLLGNAWSCYATGAVTGESNVGGLLGIASGATITDCHATGNVTGTSGVGGLVGLAPGPELGLGGGAVDVLRCYATGIVTGTGCFVGGLAGMLEGEIGMSYAEGDVYGGECPEFGIPFPGLTGGLAGCLLGNAWDCYATGAVTGESAVGGLVGLNVGNVTNSYSIGSVTGDEYVGGLVGLDEWEGWEDYEEGVVTNSFWDIQTSGQGASAGGIGKTTAQMKSITTFSGATWDIVAVASPSIRNPSYIWNIVDDETYPFLSWEP